MSDSQKKGLDYTVTLPLHKCSMTMRLTREAAIY